ncbi:MAG: hypothetical protein LBN33_02070 [Desulfovibrio sp.]|jgi:hypothetical protein|nr:hypothetical protein [Desulfovibrio sp.]
MKKFKLKNAGSRLTLLAAALLALNACAGKDAPSPARQVLSGPPLHIAGEYGDLSIAGEMDRGCMVGFGSLELRGTRAGTGQAVLLCKGRVDAPALDRGRVRGILDCGEERRLAFSMRNLGPDQGIGIGREKTDGDLLLFFYHAAKDEAARRFPEIKADMERIRNSDAD